MISKVRLLLSLLLFYQSYLTYGNSSRLDSLIQKVEIIDDEIAKCDLYNHIAEEYIDIDPYMTFKYAEKGLNLSLSLNYELGMAYSYFVQGEVSEELSRYNEAIDNYVSALIIFKHVERQDDIAETNYRLGRICKTTGNYEKGLEYCLNALRIRETQDEPLKVSRIYNTLGSIYKYLGDNNLALEYYLKCKDIQEKYRQGGISSGTYNYIGIIYKRLGREEEALQYYKKSLQIREEDGDSLLMASSYNNIAAYYLDKSELDSAFKYLQMSRMLKEKYGDKESLVNIYSNYSDYYYQVKDFNKALEFRKRSLEIAQELNLSLSVSSSYLDLNYIYQAKGDYKQALDYHIKYTQINDSIYDVDKSMRIAQLAMIYDTELKQIEHELEDQKRKFVNFIIYGALFFLVVILFFIYRSQKSKINRQQLEQANLKLEKENLAKDLDTKKRELTRNIIHLTEKNELLFNLKKTLQKLKCNLKAENKPSIQAVINEMTVSYNNKMWDEFEVHFINVHEDFYNNLYKSHPDLTQNEKRLAAFLKLNMSSKEISMITKQSVHSITVARTRLRKKLDLANTDISLVSYLEKF